MSWNYRVCRYPQGGVGLHEVYYDEAGNMNGWTEKPVGFADGDDDGDGLEQLIGSLERALKDARERPILDLPEEA